MSGNRLTFAATLDDKVSGGLDLISRRFKENNTQTSLLGNIGANAVAKGFGLIDSAASSLVGVLADATRGAMADEESQNRLKASLLTNVPGWDGSTAAIEKNIVAKQRLGFVDEDLRDSLTVLVGATHDLGKAQEIQNTAMDLARFKGIDLKTASEALIKVEAGQYRSLKQLGIVLKEGATQQDALNAVQAVARGQAEAYAQTNAGKLVASQIKVNEAMEHLGYTTMPAVTAAIETAADAIDGLTSSFDLLSGKAPDTDAGWRQIITTINSLNPLTWSLSGGLNNVNKAATDLANEGLSHLADGAQQAESRFGGVTDSFSANASAIEQVNKDIVSSWTDTRSQLETITTGLGESVYGPIIAKEELLALKAEERSLRQKRAAKDTTEEEKRQIDLQLNQDYQKELGMLAHLAALGDAAAKEELTRRAQEILANKDSTADNRKWAQGVLTQLHIVERGYQDIYHAAKVSMSINPYQWTSKFGGGARASGGPVGPGVWDVGEEGPEKLILGPDGTGMVLPNSGIPAKTGGARMTLVIPLIVNGREFARATVSDIDEEAYWRQQAAGGAGLEG